MAFDSGMLACALDEVKRTSLGCRVEKVFQPERDEILFLLRGGEGGKRLLIHAGGGGPRLSLTSEQKENPAVPPMLCMLLRKHLQGARLSGIEQPNFDRVAKLEFDTRDEMGFACVRRVYAELMGKYSNFIFTDGEDKILSVLHPVEFSPTSDRCLLPGVRYEVPLQERKNPLGATEADFAWAFRAAEGDRTAAKVLTSVFCGLSDLVAREIVFRAAGDVDATVSALDVDRTAALAAAFFADVREGRFSPTLVFCDNSPAAYAFCALTQYESLGECRSYASAGELLDDMFRLRDRERYIRQRADDLFRLLSNAESRIRKKLLLQEGELAECEKGDAYKSYGDLITANLYRLHQGDVRVELTDYAKQNDDGSFGTLTVQLDPRLSPAANAQRYYKKYAKAKNAKTELTRQIALGRAELAYLETVRESLSHAEGAADLAQIREELCAGGYGTRSGAAQPAKKAPLPAPAEFRTSGGYRVLCGKNNLQNEHLTHKLAGKNDYWFHAKGMPGSHVVLFAEGDEPSERDFTEAAEIAALYSASGGAPHTEVDYTLVKNLKKPAGAKPGYVIYHQNWSCTVSPDREEIEKKRVK